MEKETGFITYQTSDHTFIGLPPSRGIKARKHFYPNSLPFLISDCLAMHLSTPAAAHREEEPEAPKVVTTEAEKEAYFIIKSILRPHVDIERILLNDNQTYCAIQLDNSWHQIARLYFNGSKSFFVTFDENKKEIRHNIETLNEIYKFSDKLINSLKIQLSK